jgi:hypothetical protein
MFSKPMTHRDFLTALGGTGTAETRSRGYSAA